MNLKHWLEGKVEKRYLDENGYENRNSPWASCSLRSPNAFRRPFLRAAWNIFISSASEIEVIASAVLLLPFAVVLIDNFYDEIDWIKECVAEKKDWKGNIWV